MSPGDISSFPSSIAPSSPETASISATPSRSPASDPTCLSTSSISSSALSSSAPSKTDTALATTAQLSNSSLNPFPAISNNLDDVNSSLASTGVSSSSSSFSSPNQDEERFISNQSSRSGIFLPNFLSNIRIISSRPPSSNSHNSSNLVLQPSSPSSVNSTTTVSSNSELSSKSNTGNSRSRHKDTTRANSVIVTDVRNINIRDISTVPTLTSFNQKRSKRRSSSASNHSFLPSSSCTSTSSYSGSHTTATSRRKRIKKSSHSTRTPWNLCTSSCGCTQSQGSLAAEHSVESLTDLEHRYLTSTTDQHMESTGRIRTISESEVSTSDSTQTSHRITHQHQQHPQQQQQHPQRQQHQRSRQSSSHQLGQGLTSESIPHNQTQESSSSLHIQHRFPQLSPQQVLHGHNHTPLQPVLNISLPHRIKTQNQERNPQHIPHHKRQRSPQPQQMVLEVPSPSTSSPSTARVSSKSTERLKRPRHQSGDLHENASDEKNLIEPSHIVARQDKDNKLHSNHTKKHTADAPINTRRDSLQIPTPSHTSQHERTVILQVRQPSRIHPFDNESIAPNISGMPHDDRHHPLDGPMKTPASLTEMEPSIHPLDPEARENTKSRQSYPIEKKHREALDHKQPTPEHNTQRSITTSQQQNTDIIPSNEIISNHSSSLHNSSSVSTPISRPQQQPALQTNRSVAPSSAAAKPNAVALQLPITRDTLRELDLFEIFKNPQLRHDIVFDPHLQFRPNFDGERGLAKRREADRFWHEVGTELNARRAILTARRDATTKMLNLAGLSSSSPSSRMIQQQAQQMCPLPKAVLLPRLIDELREILLSLLPAVPNNHDKSSQQDGANQENSERALLSSTLDPDLLLQELDHGVLDVHKLFRYLGDSLKGHCAPMRDTLVESMVHTVVNLDEIVRGIRMCFEILEWMKLDIANHQLRTLRPWLLDNSIDFEQRYFTEHLQRGGSLQRTTEWFKKSWICWESVKQLVIGRSSPNVATFTASHQPSLAPSLTVEQDGSSKGSSPAIVQPAYAAIGFKRRTSVVSTDIGENILDGVVNEGLLEMILQPHGSVSTMPETFELDHYRMLLFHNDFQDLTILCILLILFRQLAHNCWTQQDLIEIKKVVWLLLTDENANFGANTQTGKSGSGQNGSSSNSGGSSGMKDIVIQIEFAARKVRERGVNTSATATPPVATGSRRSSLSPEIPIPTAMGVRRGSLASSVQPVAMATGNSFHSQKYASNIQRPLSIAGLTPILPTTTKSAPIAIPSLSASDTNLLTAWLDNALCRTSTLYKLIQKRLLIHFRRWLYLHSCSTMLVLSASCASLASAISMSSQGTDSDNQCKGDDDDDESTISEIRSGGISEQCNDSNGISSAKNNHEQTEGGVPNTPLPANTTSPAQSIEEANKAAAEALAAKLSFNTTEMEAHGLIGLEDEMTALLEKIRAVSEFNKKVYGSWYRDLVKQGRSERWLESAASSISISSSNSSTGDPDSGSSVTSKSNATSAFSASTSNNQNASTKTMA